MLFIKEETDCVFIHAGPSQSRRFPDEILTKKPRNKVSRSLELNIDFLNQYPGKESILSQSQNALDKNKLSLYNHRKYTI